jgi:hypothetical protein
MKIKLSRPSPAMVIAMIALFASLGGSALAVSRGDHSSERSAPRGKLTLRFGKLVDRDTTPLDGSFFIATGHAICKKGERVVSGGVRQIGGSATNIQHIWQVESGPVPSKRGWYVSMNSDLGGAARKDFLVVANCERK